MILHHPRTQRPSRNNPAPSLCLAALQPDKRGFPVLVFSKIGQIGWHLPSLGTLTASPIFINSNHRQSTPTEQWHWTEEAFQMETKANSVSLTLFLQLKKTKTTQQQTHCHAMKYLCQTSSQDDGEVIFHPLTPLKTRHVLCCNLWVADLNSLLIIACFLPRDIFL